MKKQKPVVSIITVVKNDKNNIQKTINSVRNQNFKKIEYIVLDGESTDGTRTLILRNKKKISRIIFKKDKNLYEGLNNAIKKARGRFIGILHSGDTYNYKSAVRDSINFINLKKVDFIFSNLFIRNKNGSIYRKIKGHFFKPFFLRFGIQPAHPTLFLKKNAHNQINGYTELYKSEGDFDYFCKLFTRNFKWAHYNKFTINQSRGGLSDTNYVGKYRTSFKLIEILHKNNIFTFRILFVFKLILRVKELF